MSTIQVEKSVMQRFEEICPTWAYIFRVMKDGYNYKTIMSIGKTLKIQPNLGSCKHCIIGEAWGWKDDYLENCNECARLCSDYNDPINNKYGFVFAARNPEYRPQVIQEFVEHWDSSHSNK